MTSVHWTCCCEPQQADECPECIPEDWPGTVVAELSTPDCTPSITLHQFVQEPQLCRYLGSDGQVLQCDGPLFISAPDGNGNFIVCDDTNDFDLDIPPGAYMYLLFAASAPLLGGGSLALLRPVLDGETAPVLGFYPLAFLGISGPPSQPFNATAVVTL